MPQSTRLKVTAVVVSYNRSAILGDTLDALAAQTRPVDHVIVVDNASTDGAADVALNHPLHPEVLQLNTNLGGAGGFTAGIARALEEQGHDSDTAHAQGTADTNTRAHAAADTARTVGTRTASEYAPLYIWLMDDDVVPTENALENLLRTADEARSLNGTLPTVLGSKAIWTDGREHPMSRPRPRTFLRSGAKELPTNSTAAAFQVRSLSFVSCLFDAGAVRAQARLPRTAYFMWNDDFEFTTRLLKNGIGYYTPASVVEHRTKVFGSSDADPGERFYFEVRNKLWMLRFSRDIFAHGELAEFVLKTARRWVLTFVRSDNKGVIRDCFTRGWHDGMRTAPRSNQEIFTENDEFDLSSSIAAIED